MWHSFCIFVYESCIWYYRLLVYIWSSQRSSFLVVSSSFPPSWIMKMEGNNKETASMIVLYYNMTTVSLAYLLLPYVWRLKVHTKFTKSSDRTAFSTWKKLIFGTSAKIKFANSVRLHPQSDHIVNTHTQQVKTLHMDLSWDHLDFSLDVKTHIWPQKQQFDYAGFQENLTQPHWNEAKHEPNFRQLNSPPTKPTHLQAVESCPRTYSLSLPLEWSQDTHIPTSINLGGAYKPKSQLSKVFARQLCDDTHLPQWLSVISAHSQTFNPTPASFAHTISQPTHSTD